MIIADPCLFNTDVRIPDLSQLHDKCKKRSQTLNSYSPITSFEYFVITTNII